jgi:hypothetical protein
LTADDPATAVFAARQGLRASPNSGVLAGDLIAAHVAASDRTVAATVLAEYERALDDIDGGDAPADFYRLLDPPATS